MARVILLLQGPYHIGAQESEAWLRQTAAELAEIRGVERVDIARLTSVSLRFAREWDWLMELQVASGQNPEQAAEDPAWAALLADMRLLGMRPSAALVEETLSPEGTAP